MKVMNEHIDTWIDAYLDVELPTPRRRQVEAHLASCPTCRARLAERQSLSALLHTAPTAGTLKPAAQFVAEVRLQLKPRETRAGAKTGLDQAWRHRWGEYLLPLCLLFALAFIEAVFLLSALVEFIPGLEGDLTGGLLQVFSGFGLPLVTGDLLSLLGVMSPLNWSVLTGALAALVTGTLYLSWLAGWWARQANRVTLERSI